MIRKFFACWALSLFVMGSATAWQALAQEKPAANAALPKFESPKINETLSAEKSLIETETEKILNNYDKDLDAIYPLLTHANAAVREEALNKLRYRGDEVELQIAPIADRLSDPNLEVAQAAAYTLRELGPKSAPALPAILWLTEQEDARAETAFYTLAAMKAAAAPAVPRLIQFVVPRTDDESDLVESKREDAIETLGEIGPAAAAAIPILVAHLKHWGTAEDAATSLGKIGAEKELLAVFKSTDEEKPDRAAVIGLGFLEKPSAKVLPALVDYIAKKSDDEYDRVAAIRSVGKLRPTTLEILKVLGQGTKDKEKYVRQCAVEAIGGTEPALPEAIPYMLATLSDAEEDVRETAARALGGLKVEPAARLKALLTAGSAGSWEIRSSVNYAISNSESAKEFWPILWKIVSEEKQTPLLRAYTITRLSDFQYEHKDEIVPFLSKVLADKQEPEVVRAAAACLLWSDRREAADILKLLEFGAQQEESDQVMVMAIHCLASNDKPESVPLMVEVLKKRAKARLRNDDVFEALERMGPEAAGAVPAVIAILREKAANDDDYKTGERYLASSMLGEVGPAAKDAILPLMQSYAIKNEYGSTNSAAVMAIGQIAGPLQDDPTEVVNFLINILNDKKNSDIYSAARALELFGPRAEAAIPALRAHLNDEYSYQRETVLDALGAIGPAAKDTVPEILVLAKDAAKDNQEEAVEALGKIAVREEEVMPVLIPLLAVPDLREETIQALKAFGPKAKEAVPALVEQLKFGTNYEKIPLLETLTAIGPGAIDAFDPLLELMQKSDDDESTLREQAKLALEAISPDDSRLAEALKAELRDEGDMRNYIEQQGREAGPLLLELLKSGSPQTKLLSIGFLQELFPKGTKAALETALDDADPQVQQSAAAALVQFGNPNARQLELLMSAFLAAKEEEEIDWKLRNGLQSSMRQLGPRLIASLADTELSLAKRRQALELLMNAIYLLRPLQKELTALLENPTPSTQQAAAVLMIYTDGKDARLPKLLDGAFELDKESALLSRQMIYQAYVRQASEADADLPLKVVTSILQDIASGESENGYSLPHLLQSATLDEAQVASLVKLLDDEDRANLAYSTLGYAKCAAPDKLIDAMLARVEKIEESDRYTVTQVLIRNQESSLPRMVTIATSVDQPLAIRLVAMQALAGMKELSVKEGKPLAGLLKDESPSVRYWTAITLAKIATKPDPLLPHLTSALSDKDHNVSSQASYALNTMGAKATPAVPELIELLASKDEDIRSRAVDVIRAIGPPAEAAVPALLVALTKAEEEYQREPIARALRRIGPPAEAKLLAALEQAKDAERLQLLSVFTICRIPAAVPQLKQSLASHDVAERRAAARALACYPEADEACLAILLELASDKDEEQARQGVEALGRMGERAKTALPVLQGALSNRQLVNYALNSFRQMKAAAEPALPALIDLMEHPNHTSEVARILGEIGSPQATEVLIALLDNDAQTTIAADALAKIKPSPVALALPKLYAKLRDPYRRANAIWAIGNFGPDAKAAIPMMLKGMKTSDAELRTSCISVLGRIGKGSTEAAEALLPLLDDPDQDVQRAAMAALGEIEALPKRCVPALVKKMAAEDSEVRYAAISSLGGFHAEAASAVPVLLKDHFKNEKTQWAVVNTLGEIGPAAAPAVPQLMELLQRGKTDAPSRIVEALGKIGPAAAAALPAIEPFTKDGNLRIKYPALRAYWQIDPVQAKKLGLYQPHDKEEYEGEYDDY